MGVGLTGGHTEVLQPSFAGDADDMATIRGRCHCGNISFDLEWPGDAADMTARACGCSYCTKHGARWTSNPGGQVTVRVADRDALIKYRFGHQTTDFNVCAQCGNVPVTVCTIDGDTVAVVNVNTFEDLDSSSVKHIETDFDGETQAERLARRQRNWTPMAYAD